MSLLQSIVNSTRARVHLSSGVAMPGRGDRRGDLCRAVGGRQHLAVIGEFKRRSPSAGVLAGDADPVKVVRGFAAAGVSAASILTEPTRFGGRMSDLYRVRDAFPDLPILMKDFILDPRQVIQGANAGASGVLLVLRMLQPTQLGELLDACRGAGVAPLLECHNQQELGRALEATGQDVLLGINNRDLDTLCTDTAVADGLLPMVPADRVVVAESGYSTAAELRRLVGRCDGVLVGTSLLQAADPAALLGGVRR